MTIFLSTLSLRRATYTDLNSAYGALISIHALLAESDVSFLLYDTSSLIFLSTLSLRRATEENPTQKREAKNFYPRSPCGERRKYHTADRVRACISIHALLAESDTVQIIVIIMYTLFLSTLSLRRATSTYRHQDRQSPISIHALLAESDLYINRTAKTVVFLSTLSLRRATIINSNCNFTQKFLSTLSLRRATANPEP